MAEEPKGKRVFFLESLYWLVSRAVVFCFLFSLLAFALYLLGNFQEFLDSTQVLLLAVLRFSLLAEVGLAALYLPIVLLRGELRAGRLILVLLSAVLCMALLLGLSFLSAWFQL